MSVTIALLGLLAFTACVKTKPKVINGGKPDFGDTVDTANNETFRLKFAYRDPAAIGTAERTIYLQAANNTGSIFVSTCNNAGTGCVCEFLNSAGTKIDEAESSEISYDSKGNYLRCQYNSSLSLGDLHSVRLKNLNGTKQTPDYTIVTSLTAQQIVGDGLDFNRVRRIYRYDCLFNFLQKQGTTDTYFDCNATEPGNLCGSGGNGDFCILQTSMPFNLYQDNYSSNMERRLTDILYNNTTTGVLCGLQVKRVDCGGNEGTPVLDFGIYADASGIFDTPIQLVEAPGSSASVYGYAAQTSTYNGSTVCPPGLSLRTLYQVTPTPSTDITPSHNFTNTITVYRVANSLPTALAVNQIYNTSNGTSGRCNSATQTCVLPNTRAEGVRTYAYTASTSPQFCVLPSTLF